MLELSSKHELQLSIFSFELLCASLDDTDAGSRKFLLTSLKIFWWRTREILQLIVHSVVPKSFMVIPLCGMRKVVLGMHG